MSVNKIKRFTVKTEKVNRQIKFRNTWQAKVHERFQHALFNTTGQKTPNIKYPAYTRTANAGRAAQNATQVNEGAYGRCTSLHITMCKQITRQLANKATIFFKEVQLIVSLLVNVQRQGLHVVCWPASLSCVLNVRGKRVWFFRRRDFRMM